MSYFYSLRGWLEIEPKNFSQVVNFLTTLKNNHLNNPKHSLYNQGWCWQETPINWTSYVFYGADLTEEGLILFETTLKQLISLNLDLSGYFHAQGEDEKYNITYRIDCDIINKKIEQATITLV
jgi:hypothetical protein